MEPFEKIVQIVDEIISKLETAISGDDKPMRKAFDEAKNYFSKNKSVKNPNLNRLLKAHGLSGSQLELKLSIYNEIKKTTPPDDAWYDFVNSFLGSIPDQLIPGVGAIKEIKEMLHIKRKHKI